MTVVQNLHLREIKQLLLLKGEGLSAVSVVLIAVEVCSSQFHEK